MPSESVLCVRRKDLPSAWLEPETACPLAYDDYLTRLSYLPYSWQPRRTVEVNENYKQLIPYLVLQSSCRKFTAAYHRQGSEARLHGLWSIGIGGHVNPSDCQHPSDSLETILNRGLRREMQEELNLLPPENPISFLGIINEDLTPVGRVHLGVVHCFQTDHRRLLSGGRELIDFQWYETSALALLSLEHWSRLTLKLL